MKLTIDYTKPVGAIKPMNAVNNGPVHIRTADQNLDNFVDYKAARIPFARTHDASFFWRYGGEHTVDVHLIFPSFDADPYDPASYDFYLTDEYMEDIVNAGTQVFYRLGSKIEHESRKYGTMPPKDFRKWAVICEHIIAHLNEGWANGHHFGIKYWEIWNEPDGSGDNDPYVNHKTWGGTREQFYELYEITAKHLRSKFPDIKIGGPALCWVNPDWTKPFLARCKANDVPLDFFSWHLYTADVLQFAPNCRLARQILDEAGFTETESILNEWNYVTSFCDAKWFESLKTEKSLKGAAFIAAAMSCCQNEPLDLLMYYDARPCEMNGLFSTGYYEKLKGYYAISAWSDLSELGTQCEALSEIRDVYVTAAKDSEGRAMSLISYYTDSPDAKPKTFLVKLTGAPSEELTLARLLAAMLVSLVACGTGAASEDTTASDTTTAPESTETTALVPDLPDTDWEGREFRVLGRENTDYPQFTNFEIYAESENGDVVNDAVFRRNSSIEDKYNVKISQTLFDDPEVKLQKAIMANEDNYDIAFTEIRNCSPLALEGYFYDLNDVEHIDFTKPWWNPEVNENLAFGDNVFLTTSDFSLRDKNRAYILVHNRDMVESFQLDPIVDLVRSGKWTLDRMSEYSKLVAADLYGDGMEGIVDRWGLGMDSFNAFGLLVYGGGNRITTRGENGKLELTVNTERMVDTIEKAVELACDTETAFFCNDMVGKVDSDPWYAMNDTFTANNALFISTFPHELKKYSAACDFTYQIIPAPKLDEEQEKYYSLADVYGMVFGIPISTQTPEFSGFMLEALSAASTDTTLPAYIEITCKVKHTYDPDSADMLDIIFDGIVYDFGHVTNLGNMRTIIIDNIANSKSNNFSSAYASAESSAKAALEKLLEQVDALG